MIMNDQYSGNVDKEMYQFFFCFFDFKQMFLKPCFKGPFGLSNILHSSASFAASENIYNILWFQSKSELFTTENCLWLTEEIIVDRQIKWLQQVQLLALHLEILGYILFLLYWFLHFRSIGDLIGESLILRWFLKIL